MLVIISDLHLTDGTSGATLHPGAFHIFAERLHDMAQRASWRSDGRYRPVERIDLVLLGDVLDITRSNHWLTRNTRPWQDAQSKAVVDTVATITDDILWQNSDGLKVLRSLAAEGAVSVAPTTQNGEPAYNAQPQPVPIRTHYMVGNHDWQLHLRGENYDMLRQKVAHHLGLANRHNAPFPHDPFESEELLEALRRHRVFARHGDIFDPINFTEDRDASSLGDGIVIELVNRFVLEVEQTMGEDLPDSLVAGLQEIDSVRPLLLIPVWLEGMLSRSCPMPGVRKHVKKIWDRLVDEFLELEMVRDRDTWSPFDVVDGLQLALKFSKRLSIGWAGKTTAWMHSLRGAKSESYYEHALSEQDFRNRRARHIVYGHTHNPETIALDASYADGYVLNQSYFNSGTWRRIHRPAAFAPGDHEFVPSDAMTYIAFFQGDERGGRPYETWSGALGVSTVMPQRPMAARQGVSVPQSAVAHASTQPLPPSGPPLQRPHFSTAPGSYQRNPARG
ncbi:metallophosphoesterase family protein [Lignipirellula cremea]|uniref:Uncharacterized protein n=1 Tax=Lignipirellula cremea TaxID=2528010 RepID=A0A518DSP5_9BACT|nr:metallophosphoesterase [Lignipirellula cremea]QDU94862.1 hypothetical protein Pla8534_26700 [Lignipirellula cremea]